eukprot:jgi/Hompol1/2545/HPOL_001776-RA
MMGLIQDQTVLDTKFMTVFAAIAFARDEVIWYFTHYDRDPKKKKTETKSMDLIVIELIYLVHEMVPSRL